MALSPQLSLRPLLLRRPLPAATAAASRSEVSNPVRIVVLVGEGSVSPLKGAPWEEVMKHTATRLKWVDDDFSMSVFTDDHVNCREVRSETLSKEISNCDLLVSVAVEDKDVVSWLLENSRSVPNVLCFASSPLVMNKLGGEFVRYAGKQNIFWTLAEIAKPAKEKESGEVLKTVSDAWDRHNADDIRFCLLVVINSYVRPVSMLKNLRAKGLSSVNCMVKNCQSQILNCLFDPKCRKALQCLNSCSPADQVCNYRCIASYESPNLEAFSLCVLQKHNCLELDAEIPSKPYVAPLSTFRGETLSHEVAEDLFIGWLGELEWSWRVVGGQNPAYDQFPCQYQLFYRGKARGSVWYEPVFQVRTLEGMLVWRRRKYRVKRAAIPGTFYFSVLDNGVVSKEFWTIVDVANDLSWGLFHYSGAAQAAGLSYTGAVLVTPDGEYPSEQESENVALALEKCSIKNWELYMVDNCSCVGAPLGLPDGSNLHCKIRVKQ